MTDASVAGTSPAARVDGETSLGPPLLEETTTDRAGLYVHVPFCSEICPYCDFAVVRDRPAVRRTRHRRWIDALRIEARSAGESGRIPESSLPFDSVYFGGGTPSSLGPDELREAREILWRSLPIAPGADVHLEANPEDVGPERVAAWKDLGVGFLSLGVQALDDRDLGFLGRRHSARSAREAVGLVLDAGFRTVSVDLIAALPGRDLAHWDSTLRAALDLGVSHLSLYGLEIHPATTFGKRLERREIEPRPSDDQAAELRRTHEVLLEHGWDVYEVSNFARGPAHRSRHNPKYWIRAPYLGLGPSAHSSDGGSRRWWNHRHVDRWARELAEGRGPVAGREDLSPHEVALELLMLGLRTPTGVDLAAFSARTGLDLRRESGGALACAVERGLVEPGFDARLRPTLEGLLVADRIAAEIAPDPG